MDKHFKYIANKTHNERVAEYLRVSTKHMGKILIIMESPEIQLKKTKYVMEYDQSVVQLMTTFRSIQELKPQEAVFLFTYDKKCNPVILNGQDMVGTIAQKYKYDDGFVYIHVQKENTFG